jgi:glycine/D-amino acid oxidase-like deaminating enzyme
MTTPASVDLLVVGQGLAGTFVALEALDRGFSVRVVDEGHARSASRVGAGLFTPVTGKRFALTWMAEPLLAHAARRYGELERRHGRIWRRELPTLRLLDGEDELRGWARRTDRPEIAPYVRAPAEGEREAYPVAPAQDAAVVEGSGWVDTADLISFFRAQFSAHGILREERFLWTDARETSDAVIWRDVTASRVVFCEGYQGAENPLLNGLTFRNARGDLLDLRSPGFPTRHIVNRGHFLLPVGGDVFRMGATFDWDRLTPEPTPDGREALEASLRSWLRIPYEVLRHDAGVRPVCTRTRPVAGLIPGHPRVALLTGFGAKGVLYAPFFACHLLDHLQNGSALHPEVDPTRRWV